MFRKFFFGPASYFSITRVNFAKKTSDELNKSDLKVTPSKKGLFAHFSFNEPALTCTYVIATTPDEASNYYDIERTYSDIPLRTALEHLKKEYKAFNAGENVPDHYKASNGFPFMLTYLKEIKRDGQPLEFQQIGERGNTITLLERLLNHQENFDPKIKGPR